MCGIAGHLFLDARPADSDLLGQSLDAIVHRGPDHRGTFMEGSVALGNQRLKIRDLEGGNQPIYNEDGKVVVVYNGEIYNYEELRRDLENKGHHFSTNVDTEVLVHLYEEHGIDFVKKLNGIFAFALFDRRTEELYLARDRFGVKPLFYLQTPSTIGFSSEVNGLKVLPEFDGSLDPQALSIYLKFCYIPQPWSAFRQIRRLEAGHYLKVDQGGSTTNVTYFDLDFSKKQAISRQDAKSEIRRLLQQSVQRQLVSDVPVGIFLSGGVDSCGVLSYAQPVNPEIETFTLAFDNPSHDESRRAKPWAEFFGVPHHDVQMHPSQLVELAQARIEGHGEPLGPWINAGQKYICQHVAGAGFKVMLNGAGGDELFCGYPTLNAAVLARHYGRLPRWMKDHLLPALVNRLPAGKGNLPLSYKLKSFVAAAKKDPTQAFFDFKALIPPSLFGELLSTESQKLLDDTDPDQIFHQYDRRTEGWDFIDKLQYMDFKTFLEGSILMGGDSASMAASVEERVPFLDNDLVDFALSLPRDIKFDLFRPKGLLRDALKDELRAKGGDNLLKREEKRGYWLPANTWLRSGPVREFAESQLNPEQIQKTGFFDSDGVQKLLTEHSQGRHNHDRKIQAIFGLNHFLEGTL